MLINHAGCGTETRRVRSPNRAKRNHQLISYAPQYSVPVVKYDRNGFKPRPRQFILTQVALHVAEEAKIKQRVEYVSLKGEL